MYECLAFRVKRQQRRVSGGAAPSSVHRQIWKMARLQLLTNDTPLQKIYARPGVILLASSLMTATTKYKTYSPSSSILHRLHSQPQIHQEQQSLQYGLTTERLMSRNFSRDLYQTPTRKPVAPRNQQDGSTIIAAFPDTPRPGEYTVFIECNIEYSISAAVRGRALDLCP